MCVVCKDSLLPQSQFLAGNRQIWPSLGVKGHWMEQAMNTIVLLNLHTFVLAWLVNMLSDVSGVYHVLWSRQGDEKGRRKVTCDRSLNRSPSSLLKK